MGIIISTRNFLTGPSLTDTLRPWAIWNGNSLRRMLRGIGSGDWKRRCKSGHPVFLNMDRHFCMAINARQCPRGRGRAIAFAQASTGQ